MSLSKTAEQQVFQRVKRVCYAGLDSVTLRVEIARRVGISTYTDHPNLV